MRRNLLSLFLFCFVSLGGYAQHTKGTFTLYPKLGVEWSKLNNDKIYYATESEVASIDESYRTGFVGGAELHYQFTELGGASVGLFFDQMGSKHEEEYDGTHANLRQRLNYLTMPILATFNLGHTDFQLKAGINLSYLLNAKAKYEDRALDGGTTDTDANIDYTNTDEFHRFNVGLAVGASYEWHHIILDARYNFGLSNVYKQDNKPSTRSFWLTLGYGFTL
ncbi:MAG: porin family protein [Prevotella sp.]|jgi:hypothetical protein